MMNELYFKNVPQFGDLYLDYVFHEFEGEPILFTCTNKNNKIFICTCFEIREKQEWLVAECSLETLEEMIDNSIDVKTAICKNGMITTITMDIEGRETYSCKKVSEIDELDFPKEGTLLKLHGTQEKLYLGRKLQEKSNAKIQSVSWYIGRIRTGEKKYTEVYDFKETVEQIEFCLGMNAIGKEVKQVECYYDANESTQYKKNGNNPEIDIDKRWLLAS